MPSTIYTVPCWGTSATTTTTPWDLWNEEYITTSATTITWSNWSRDYHIATSATGTNVATWTIRNEVRVGHVSEAQAQADLLRQNEWRARRIEAEAERAKARERAALLLQENLTEQQRLELAEKGHFSLRVIDSDTKEERHYRIRRGRSRNIDRMDASGRKVLHRLCIHPTIACPDEDTMLAQKLMLETDEMSFLRIANRS